MSENEKPDVDDELGDDDLEAVVGGLTMKVYKVKGEAWRTRELVVDIQRTLRSCTLLPGKEKRRER